MNRLVIQVKYGGLGDHLFFSHIPRIAKEMGVREVLISKRSDYRHTAYKSLIWANNPFIDGFTDEPGMDFKELEVKVLSFEGGLNLLDRNMLALGLDDGKRWHDPEIHLPDLKEYPILSDCSIYDGNYISNVGTPRTFPPKTDYQIILGSDHKRVSNGAPGIKTKGIEDYCNMIVSCKEFSCVTSGQATLAAALKKPSKCYYGDGQNPLFHHSKLHTYIKI